jgi:carbonic anhydrase
VPPHPLTPLAFVLLGSTALFFGSSAASAAPAPVFAAWGFPSSPEGKRSVEVLEILHGGNMGYALGQRKRARPWSGRPMATVVTCTDPSVAVEPIFGAGQGALQVVRARGLRLSPVDLASVAHAIEDCSLLIVLGHSHCSEGNCNSQAALDQLRAQNESIRDALDYGALHAVTAVFDPTTGRVQWRSGDRTAESDPDPDSTPRQGPRPREHRSDTLPWLDPAEALARLKAPVARSSRSGDRPPIASVLTCLELAPGYVIGRTEGELYSVRVAGPVCGPDQLQQLESGVDEIATPLLVVLTHTDCGVLRALAEDRLDPSLSAQLAPALHHALACDPELSPVGAAASKPAAEQLGWTVVAELFRRSAPIRERVSAGLLRVVVAVYTPANGELEWLGEHPKQEKLIESWTPVAPAPKAPAAPPTPQTPLPVAYAAGAGSSGLLFALLVCLRRRRRSGATPNEFDRVQWSV